MRRRDVEGTEAVNTVLAVSNLIGAVLALAANAWAATVGPCHGRPVRAVVAGLAGVYVALYVAFLTGVVDNDARVAMAQGIGPAVWLVVWVVPAVDSARSYHRDLGAMRGLIDSVGEKL